MRGLSSVFLFFLIFVGVGSATGGASFVQSSYTVQEDEGEVRVCLNGGKGDQDELVVRVRTEDITASASVDYQVLNERAIFNTDSAMRCFSIAIRDDGRAEEAEQFRVAGEVNDVNATFTTVTILDNDGVVIGFESELYRVRAGGEVVLVVAVLAGQLEDPVMLSIRTRDGTARAPLDYQEITEQNFNLNSVTPRREFILRTKQNGNEDLISDHRSLRVVIQSDSSIGSGDMAQMIRLRPGQARVEITKNATEEEETTDTTDGGEGTGAGRVSDSSGDSGVTAVAIAVAAALVVLLAVVTATLLCVLHQRRRRRRKRKESSIYYSTPTPQHRTETTDSSDNTTLSTSEQDPHYCYIHTHTWNGPGTGQDKGKGSDTSEDAEPAYEAVKPKYENIEHAYAKVGPGYEQIGLQTIAVATPYLEPVKSKTN